MRVSGIHTFYLLRLYKVFLYFKMLDMYCEEHFLGNADTYEKPDVADNHAGKTWKAQYDKVDNLLSLVKSTRTILPEISNTGDAAKNHQYSRFDDWALEYDKNGNTTQKGTQKFYYNYRNQMVRAVENNATTAEYKYDAMGRRIEKKVGVDTTRYFYSGHQVIEERDSSDTILKQFIYGTGIDELLMTAVYEDGVATPYYMHTNRIGSITAVTDENGNVVERISYEAFGKHTITDYKTDPENPTIVDNSVIGNEILFQGRRYDKETNLYYYRARSYDPIMGRFLQNDPLGYIDSMNMYQAFNQNPVNYVDPMGRQSFIIDVGDGRYIDNQGWKKWSDFSPKGSQGLDNIDYSDYWKRGREINSRIVADDEQLYFVVNSEEAKRSDKIVKILCPIVNAAIDFIPIVGDFKGFGEGFAGKDAMGNKMVFWERGLCFLCLGELRKVVNGAEKSIDLVKAAGEIADVSKDLKKVAIGSYTNVDKVLPDNVLEELGNIALLDRVKNTQRFAKHGSNWDKADLFKSIKKQVGDNPTISVTEKGKVIYSSSNHAVEVVHDYYGNYFTIIDTNLTGKRKYLDLNGKVPNNVEVNGKIRGASKSEYRTLTHFRVK